MRETDGPLRHALTVHVHEHVPAIQNKYVALARLTNNIDPTVVRTSGGMGASNPLHSYTFAASMQVSSFKADN